MFQSDAGEINDILYSEFWGNTDYSVVHEKYAKCFSQCLGNYLAVQFEFEEVVHPREYNFVTDRIFAKVNRADFCKLLKKVRGARLNKVVKEMFTSRSGFISSYSNKIKEWGRIDTWDYNQCGAVLAAAVELYEESNPGSIDETIAWDWIDDEEIEKWLIDAARGKAIRALNINDYLRRRAERKYRHSLVAA